MLTRADVLSAGERVESVPSRRVLRRVASLFRPYRGQVALVGVLAVAYSVLGVANPILTKILFDRGLFRPGGHHEFRLVYELGAVMIVIALLLGAISIWETYLTSVVGQRVMQDLRNRLYSHLQRMSLRFFTATRTGEIQSRIANDVGGVQLVVTGTFASVLSNVVILAASLGAMLFLSWQLTALSAVVLPAFVLLSRRVGRAQRRIARETQRSLADLSVITEETLSVSGVLLGKVFDRQRSAIERFEEESKRLAGLRVRQQMAGRILIGSIQAFLSISPVLIYLVAALSLSGGTGMTAGTIVAFMVLQTRVVQPMTQLVQASIDMQASLALFERIFQYLDLSHDIVDDSDAIDVDPEEIRGAITFAGVHFTYGEPAASATNGAHRNGRWTLEDVNLEIAAGQLAAIVGPTGAGKTTISYLVPRLYEATTGSVAIDGIDVRRIRLSSLAGAVGMVTQETYLFHASVRENLLYAHPEATEEEIETAARAALVHDRILELPDGYGTPVGERGYRLSGGEKQRLAIARVVLKDPRILILDEATSALDTVSERLVQQALEPLMSGRTTIAIAHRLSTILAADVIFFLDRGRVIERGTHTELVAQGGRYAELYDEQFQHGLVEARCADGFVLASGAILSTAAEPVAS
jgi:ATP-binding cassette subfamily B protein